MKNFKKVLALVLVLATLLGLATMASATEYKDADKIDVSYDEAIKVLDLIETMQGYPNGEFRPTANITREEAAKLIAIFDNKDADISTYYTSINPFADEKGRWGESYVGYGYRAGIIAGMNATTFAPTANVTGTQFLKMALVTLGYDQEAEGFVGSSWAVNVLALAKRIGLIDDLKDGWKPENDLTRQEAAQILLNTLNAETVEYAQETKAFLNKNSIEYKNLLDKDGYFRFNGKLYLTVAGAVKTGKELYKSFDLDKDTKAEDAFARPYVKWTKDHKSVETMKAPKATFTKKFSVCELLVALGIKESDTKTKIVIDNAYINGVEKIDDAKIAGLLEGNTTYECGKDENNDDIVYNAWKHTPSKCSTKDVKFGEQGTLTQVFYEGKDAEGVKHYRVCSIDTWLAKVEKVDKTTTSRDNHKKGEDNVKLTAYITSNAGDENVRNHEYCWSDVLSHCNDFDHGDNGIVTLYHDDPTGLNKGDYVLMTYSFMLDDDNKVKGIQSLDVTEGKEGRLSGFKNLPVADPTETRVDSEYVKDAVHFHLGYADSKDKANFGTKTFFYDAYGNVIGMKDGKDTSKYAVLDKLYVEHSEGVATLYANVVSLDASIAKKVVIKDFTLNDEDVREVKDTDSALEQLFKQYGKSLADYANAVFDLNHLTNGLNFHDFDTFYDKLGKVSVNSKGEYSLNREDDNYENVGSITFKKGEPYVLVTNTTEDEIKVTSETQFLVRTGDVGDGEYEAWTGYKAGKSFKANHYEIVLNDDDAKNEYAEVVYVYDNVVFTDGKVTAYIFDGVKDWEAEEEADGTVYYYLTAYINGAKETLRVHEDNYAALETIVDGGRFVKLQYVDIDKVTTVVAVLDDTDSTKLDEDFNLFHPYTVKSYTDGGLLTVDEKIGDTNRYTMPLADNCAVYSIQKSGVVEKEELSYLDKILEKEHDVHIDWNDKNDDGVNQIVAIYVVENEKD